MIKPPAGTKWKPLGRIHQVSLNLSKGLMLRVGNTPMVCQGPVSSTRRLEEEAQILCHEVSSKFVIEPSIEEIKSDQLICLKRFQGSVRQKFHERERAKAQKATNSGGKTPSDNQEGLGTGLRPTNGCTPDSNNPRQ